MNFGFNTDVQLGGLALHVQTEDRGKRNPVIDTTVYAGGRVLHRRIRKYAEHLNDPSFNDDVLRQWLEEQHRTVIEELRSGVLVVPLPSPPTSQVDGSSSAEGASSAPAVRGPAGANTQAASGIQVQLTNPASWLKSGSASLIIEVRTRVAGTSVENAEVEVAFEGTQQSLIFPAVTNSQGRAELSFPMPHLGSGGADLVIRAKCADGEDEIRYSLRAKSKPPAV
ncbi:MAG: DUF4198 domain-containing protein [Acidipila sp.]|nr:DUF4198 domain-containing protein [Acidipila sp.]